MKILPRQNPLLPALRRFGAVLCLGLAAVSASAYTFTHTIPLGSITVDCGPAGLNLQPGDVVGIAAGTRAHLALINILGDATNPIIFANMGGKVRVGNASNSNGGISIRNSRYFKFTGDGDPAHYYGIEVFQAGAGQCLDVTSKSSDYELCFLELHNAHYAGIFAKTDPRCDGSANRGTFTQYNTRIHDNYIHDVPGEAIYAGNSYHANGKNSDCIPDVPPTTPPTLDTILYPHDLVGVRIYNNIIARTGREGIQVGCAISDCEIYNNHIREAGLDATASQGSGIQIGEGTTGKCYNNTIINPALNGISMLGLGDNSVYNNIIVNPGMQGIYNDDRATTVPGSYVRIFHNTIVDAAYHGFKTDNTICSFDVRNNVFVSALLPIEWAGTDANYTYTETNNTQQNNTTGLAFVNPTALDYRIGSGSSAINTGANLTALGMTADREGLARPFGAAHDRGASEYGALSAVITTWTHPTQFGVSNGTLTVAATGGTSPYTYAWSNGASTAAITGLAEGTHTVTVTDAASTQRVRSFSLVAPSALTVKTRVLPELNNANDGSITLTPVGSPPYSVTWSHGPTTLAVTGLNTGFYSYTLTDNVGATAAGTVFVRDGGTPIYRVNAGGLAETDRVINWSTDKHPSPASSFVTTGTTLTTGSNTWNGSNGNFTEGPNNLFDCRRYVTSANTQMNWSFPVTNGLHEVQLYFNETNNTYTVGSRVFDVQIEGVTHLDNFDIYAIQGYNRPGQHTFWVDVTDGTLNLNFIKVSGVGPIINAIAIHTHTGGMPAGTPVCRVDAGGNAQSDTPIGWDLDKNPSSSTSPYLSSSGQLNTGPNTYSGTNTTGAPNNIFANYRYDPATGDEMSWEFPAVPGTYRLNLYYRDFDTTVNAAGVRFFDVAVEGNVIWTNYDPYALFERDPGRESLLLTVTDGVLDLDFLHKNTRAPIINGISVHRVK